MKDKKNKCLMHDLDIVPCIQKNFQGCIVPHPNTGTHVIYMCPECWTEWQERKKNSRFRW